MPNGFPIDPHDVLGVPFGASAREVRDAYRAKTKKHHPDLGGDEWAFRVVVHAFKILSGAESDAGLNLDFAKAPGPPSAPRPGPAPPTDGGAQQVRAGVRDRMDDPARIVAVELLRVRYEARDPLHLDETEPLDDPNLSASLNLIWPDPEATASADLVSKAPGIVLALTRVSEAMRERTPVVTARTEARPDGRRVACWLSYAGGEDAWQAFKTLRNLLKGHGLGVRQWTRDLVIPRPAAD